MSLVRTWLSAVYFLRDIEKKGKIQQPITNTVIVTANCYGHTIQSPNSFVAVQRPDCEQDSRIMHSEHPRCHSAAGSAKEGPVSITQFMHSLRLRRMGGVWSVPLGSRSLRHSGVATAALMPRTLLAWAFYLSLNALLS